VPERAARSVRELQLSTANNLPQGFIRAARRSRVGWIGNSLRKSCYLSFVHVMFRPMVRVGGASDTMSSVLTVIDLFAGAGGLSLGLKAAGFRTVAAVENDADAARTYTTNVGAEFVLDCDVKGVDFRRFRNVDLIAGGPPCQPFSIGGLRQGSADDRDLLPEFVRAVLQIRPRGFLLENVPGLGTDAHRGYLREVLRPLAGRYSVSGPHVVNSADFGVPQSRRRMFIVGMLDKEFQMPEGDTKRHIPAGTVLTKPPIGDPNPSKIVYAKNPDLRPNPYHGQLFNGGGRPVDFAAPAPTMLASAGGNKTHFVDVGGHVPPYHKHLMRGGRARRGELPEARRLTVAECAALQTFPSGMQFFGAKSSQYTQVGNAVPVRLAQAIGEALAEQLAVHRPKRHTVFAQELYI
jgi:DNA (cytosine-5)-methyltransferase 1